MPNFAILSLMAVLVVSSLSVAEAICKYRAPMITAKALSRVCGGDDQYYTHMGGRRIDGRYVGGREIKKICCNKKCSDADLQKFCIKKPQVTTQQQPITTGDKQDSCMNHSPAKVDSVLSLVCGEGQYLTRIGSRSVYDECCNVHCSESHYQAFCKNQPAKVASCEWFPPEHVDEVLTLVCDGEDQYVTFKGRQSIYEECCNKRCVPADFKKFCKNQPQVIITQQPINEDISDEHEQWCYVPDEDGELWLTQ